MQITPSPAPESSESLPRQRVRCWNRQTSRMVVVEYGFDAKKGRYVPVSLVADDGTRRRMGSTGKEGARRAACQQVKVSFVPVISPDEEVLRDQYASVRRVSRMTEDDKPLKEDGTVYTEADAAKDVLYAIQQGMTLRPEANEDGLYALQDIGASEAARRYARRVDSICPRGAMTGRS